jgi:hypothetical protein
MAVNFLIRSIASLEHAELTTLCMSPHSAIAYFAVVFGGYRTGCQFIRCGDAASLADRLRVVDKQQALDAVVAVQCGLDLWDIVTGDVKDLPFYASCIETGFTLT